MFWTPVRGQLTIGARALAMGQAHTAVPANPWAVFVNPAVISNEEVAVGFYGLRNYGFAELTDMSAVATVPSKLGVASLGFHRYGDNRFNETRMRLGYKNDWRRLHFGLTANYTHISFGGEYGSGGALGLDIGIAAEITDGLWAGARSTNINRPKYQNIREDLYRDLALGFSYNLNRQVFFVFDMVKDVRFPVSYRGGVETKIIENLKGRVGITTKPLTYSLGFGYAHTKWDVNVAVQKHALLGFSPGLDFMLFFR